MMIDEQLPLNIEAVDQYQQRLYAQSTGWFRNFRNRCLNQLSFEQIPTVAQEEWKYTSLANITSKNWKLPTTVNLSDPSKLNEYLDAGDINVVLVNGVYQSSLSNVTTIKGLHVLPFDQATDAFAQDIQEIITKITPNDTKSLWWLNGAFFTQGIFIKVERGVVIDQTIHVVHVTTAVDHDTLLLPRCFISIAENAQANIMESHVGFEDVDYLANAVTDIKVGQAAHFSYCSAECESPRAVYMAHIRLWQEAQSHVELFSFAHGASLVRNNLSVLLKGEGCNTIMNGFYAIDGQQHVDNHTLLDIQQPNCTSYQLYKGILNDAARAVFNGKIYVHSIAQKTNGYQLNKHLLLGKSARVDTKPQLEIFADDVKCTHGATIGQLSEDEVFYLQSRCIPKATAIALLSKGFIEDIINTIKSSSVRDKLHKLLLKKFPDVKI